MVEARKLTPRPIENSLFELLNSSTFCVVAFEVKADERVLGRGLKGLRALRNALGERFVAGVAFSTGTRSYTYEDRIHVCPVDRLWRTV